MKKEEEAAVEDAAENHGGRDLTLGPAGETKTETIFMPICAL